MSKQQKSKTTLKTTLLIIITITVAIVTFFCLKEFLPNEDESVSQFDSISTSSQSTQSTSQKNNEDIVELEYSDIIKEGGVVVGDESDPNKSDTITGTVTNAKIVNDVYRITVMTDQSLSNGVCNLTIMQGDYDITSTSEITAHPHSASCIFDINLDKISSGTWDINIEVLTDYGYSGIISDIIEVKK